jgi:zinc transporter, ZIP family
LIEAAIGAGVAAFGLVVGFIVANQYRLNQRLVGQAMGLGAGVLMAVVAYALVLETIETAQHPSIVGAGMAAGAFVFYYGSRWLDQRSSSAKASESEGGGGLPLALGAVLDGVPESMVIGIGAALTGEIGIPLVIAAFIANIAESLAATPELESSGMSRQSVLVIWVAILAASVITALIGYGVMASLAPNAGAMFNGFAAGAVLMVLSTSLIPEGYEKAKRVAGLLVVLGFAIGFSLEHLG